MVICTVKMDKGPISVVISSEKFGKQSGRNPTEVKISYRLAKELKFSEPHLVRLSHVQFTSRLQPHCVVLTDFTHPQLYNGELLGFAGNTNPDAVNDYLPLLSNHVPAFGKIRLRPFPGIRISKSSIRVILIFHFVPTRLIYGTNN